MHRFVVAFHIFRLKITVLSRPVQQAVDKHHYVNTDGVTTAHVKVAPQPLPALSQALRWWRVLSGGSAVPQDPSTGTAAFSGARRGRRLLMQKPVVS